MVQVSHDNALLFSSSDDDDDGTTDDINSSVECDVAMLLEVDRIRRIDIVHDVIQRQA